MFYDRIIQLPKKRTYFLFGARQTGKSTLLAHEYSKIPTKVYNLLFSDTFRRLSARPEVFRAEVKELVAESHIQTIIVDEVQKIPELLDEIHALIESGIGCNFVLCGSSARKLKRAHANMLGGRAWTCELFPFSVLEIPEEIDISISSVLQFGLLPPVFIENDEQAKKEILRSYVETYIEQEVKIEAQLRNIGGFLRFLPLAASENSLVLNYSNIARETEVKSRTIKGYYEILEDTLLGFYLYPMEKSLRKKMTRHPKFYFVDTGIVNAITRSIHVELDEANRLFGALFETFCIGEIRKINFYKKKNWNLSYYRTESGVEVDCIIETPDKHILAIEIKSTRTPDSSHCSGLRSFHDVISHARLFLVCRTSDSFRIGQVHVVPWKTFFHKLATDALSIS